jgi:Ca-activated chloride channel family protein
VQIKTLFPSPKTEEGIKGGVVLLRMRPPTAGANSTPLQLSVTYTDREGKQFRCGQQERRQCNIVQTGQAGKNRGALTQRRCILRPLTAPWLLQHQAYCGTAS